MRTLRYPAAFVVVVALVALTAWVLAWPFEKAAFLAPVIVVGGLAAVGLVLLWGKIALSSLRESRHPRRVLAYWLVGIGLLVLLTVLGVKLPSEGG
jgi:uncharacterized membrane protein